MVGEERVSVCLSLIIPVWSGEATVEVRYRWSYLSGAVERVRAGGGAAGSGIIKGVES